MGVLIRLGAVLVCLAACAVIFHIFDMLNLEEWFFRLLAVGLVLPFCVDLFQGNQVRLFRGEYGKGICETLQEDAYVVSLFVNDAESSWTTDEIEAYMKNCIQDGLAFVESQASNYGQDIALNLGYYQENGIAKTVNLSGNIGDNTGVQEVTQVENVLILHKAARALGYSNAWEMVASDRKATGLDQIAYMVCVNKPGRAYANSDKLEAFFYDAPEFAVLYAYHPDSDILTTSSCVSHELLHLFGAEDYYEEDGKRKNRAELAEQLCPMDIMYHGSVNVWEKYVGDYTAYTIGWLDKMPDSYKKLGWWF